MNTKHRVVVTGIGLVTPVGTTMHETWNALLNSRSGITTFEAGILPDYPYRFVGRVGSLEQQLVTILSPKQQSHTDRFTHLGLVAGKQALDDAGLTAEFPLQRDRFGVYLGVGIGGLETVRDAAVSLHTKGPRFLSPYVIPKAINNLAPSWLSMSFNVQGPSLAITSACSSGADAIGLAFRAIKDGYADYMLAGGAEGCAIPLAQASFGNMRALSSWAGAPAGASRPFDAQRSGFVLAEGAGVLVLERFDLAQKRGALIYAEVVGYGATADAYHITAMHPEGDGATRALTAALNDAQINPHQVGYINAHGTGTPMNDAVETKVLKTIFKDHVDPKNQKHAVVSSTKSMTGHMIGAGGGAEIGFCALALKNQIVPPTINLDYPDSACDLDYVPHHAREHSMEYALSNSFGFGGGNACVVLKKV